MSDSIRQQIIAAITTKLAEARTAKGYQLDAGADVRLVDPRISPDDLPAIAVWPGEENVTQEFGLNVCNMQFKIESMVLFGTNNASDISEKLLADTIEAMTAYKYSLTFSSGGTFEPSVGDTITGETNGPTGYIESITLSGGSWAGGDAAGTIVYRRGTGSFSASETFKIGVELNVATVDAIPTAQAPAVTTTNSLADSIQYAQGGPGSYPEAANLVAGSVALFDVRYKMKTGNPYAKE